jgi:hypothetical protein
MPSCNATGVSVNPNLMALLAGAEGTHATTSLEGEATSACLPAVFPSEALTLNPALPSQEPAPASQRKRNT